MGEFKAFIARGNVMDMAVGVIIGGAFGKISTSLVNDIIMPLISILTGGMDFSNWTIVLKAAVPCRRRHRRCHGGGRRYGTFIATILDFLIIAFAVFLPDQGRQRLPRQAEEGGRGSPCRPPPAALRRGNAADGDPGSAEGAERDGADASCDQGLAALGLPAERYPRRCCGYAELLLETNKVMNLTAITEPEDVATLHFLDSAALLTLADFRGKTVVDVGTGAGFPGMPLKILEPSIRMTLLDSLGKRINFLQEVLRRSGPHRCGSASTPGRRSLPRSTGKALTSPSPGRWPTLPRAL